VTALLRPLGLVVLGVAVYTSVLSAHHAFSPVYDNKRTVTVSGVVTQFRFVNPHAFLHLDVTDDTGTMVKWTVEFAGRLNLSEIGWTADSLKAGERVTVTGNPTHTPSQQMAFVKIVKADGSVLLPAAAQRADTLEEERRERARRRNPQQ
jgi:DNA/RNA endonuclease YhcR with UshA esterase domain